MKYAPRRKSPRRVQIGLRVFAEVRDEIDQIAAQHGMSRNAWLEEALDRLLNIENPRRTIQAAEGFENPVERAKKSLSFL